MKTIITAITLLLVFYQLTGKNFYFSSSVGDDVYSVVQASNPETPWKTITKLNDIMDLINPGDSILFNRGDTFEGQISLTRSGDPGSNIVFGAYGNGANPILTGTSEITNWTNTGSNIWVAACDFLSQEATNVFVNGVSQQIGRYPNLDDLDKGYLNIDSHTENTLSSTGLSSLSDFSGGDAIIRTRHWVLDRVTVAGMGGGTLTYSGQTSFSVLDNYGFFIQNHLGTLDQEGEWFHDIDAGKIYIYLSDNPNSVKVSASSFSSVFFARLQRNFSISGLVMKGARDRNIWIQLSDNFEISENTICDAGNNAVYIEDCNQVSFSNNDVIRTNNNALRVQRCNEVQINANRFLLSGIRPGMARQSDISYAGLVFSADNVLCEGNTIDSVGYIGLTFYGASVIIKNNYIAHFCMTLDDGSGIYTSGDGVDYEENRVLDGNFVMFGDGAPEGTDAEDFRSAQGIYLDDRANHVDIRNNTVASCSGYGIYIHNAQHFSVSGNTSFDNHTQIAIVHDQIASDYPIRNGLVSGNIFYAKLETQAVALYRTIKDDIPQFGSFNHNYYCRPLNDAFYIGVIYPGGAGETIENIGLRQWQQGFGHDMDSESIPYTIKSYGVSEYQSENKFSNGSFDEDIDGWNSWSLYGNGQISWDNAAGMDGGSMKLNFPTPSGQSNGYLVGIGYCGEILKSKKYVLSFLMRSSIPDKSLKISALRNYDPYSDIADINFLSLDDQAREFELLYEPFEDANDARVDFTVDEDMASFWLDNVQLREAEIVMASMDDSLKFVYNLSGDPITYSSENYYMDVEGETHKDVVIPAYGSLILKVTSRKNWPTYVKAKKEKAFLKVVPNPAIDQISIISDRNEWEKLTITDITGRVVYDDSDFSSKQTINFGSLPAGCYILILSGNDLFSSAKFLIK